MKKHILPILLVLLMILLAGCSKPSGLPQNTEISSSSVGQFSELKQDENLTDEPSISTTENTASSTENKVVSEPTEKGSQSNDPFWDTAASMLLLALVFYLHYEAPPDEQNFAMVMEMLRAGAIEDEDDNRPSPLDCLFDELADDNPDHIAIKYYRSYHSGSAKTLKSIQITLAARLEKFNLESLAALTSTDELELGTLGEKKTALFALIPDNDTSFNFLVSILYTQLFQQLFYSADHIHGGSLPIPVHFLMDEFANVSLPDDFDKILSVMRSRSVSVSIILQNLAQLKALFEKQWESIVGNCDEFLYLGGNEQSTHKTNVGTEKGSVEVLFAGAAGGENATENQTLIVADFELNGVNYRVKAENISLTSFYNFVKYSLQGTTQGRYLTGGVPPVRFSM